MTWYQNLFFLNKRRRPRLRGVQEDWPPPELAAYYDERADPQAKVQATKHYQQRLEWEGFVADTEANKISQELRDDLKHLEDRLLPYFWEADQEARHFQNEYYLFQWVFILGALITSVVAAVEVYLYAAHPDAELIGWGLTRWFAALATVTSLLTSVVAIVNRNEQPHHKWFRARIAAEILRSTYFTFLARHAPFDTADDAARATQLGNVVSEVLRKRLKMKRQR